MINFFISRCLGVSAALYMLGATMWSMPTGFPLKKSCDAFFEPFFQWSGLWQGWDMFAPIPRDEDIFVSSEIYFKDGTRKTWVMTRMSEFPYLTRYQKERWRKFFNDNLRLDERKGMWDASATWVARDAFAKSGQIVAQVELVRHWRKSLLPNQPGNVLDDKRPYMRFVFHKWKAPL